MASHKEVIKRWMERSKKRNHLRGSSMRFQDDVLFSFQLPIARILKSGEALLSCRKREYNVFCGSGTSPATSKHISCARMALYGEREWIKVKHPTNGTWKWEKLPDEIPWTVFHVIDVMREPCNEEIQAAAGYIKSRLEHWLLSLGGRRWRSELRSACIRLEQATALGKRFGLNLKPLDDLQELWAKAVTHEQIYDFGGTGRLNKKLVDYNLPSSVPIGVVAALEATSDPTVRAIKAAQAQQQYGVRHKLVEAA